MLKRFLKDWAAPRKKKNEQTNKSKQPRKNEGETLLV